MAENAFDRGLMTVPVYRADPGLTFGRLAEGADAQIATGRQLEVITASAADTTAGTGARTVRVIYLDEDYDLFDEIVDCNNVTPQTTAALDIFRIIGFEVVTVGTGGANASLVTLRDVGGAGDNFAQIPIGHNSWAPGSYTVPRFNQAKLLEFYGSAGGANTENVMVLIQAEMDKYTGLKTTGQFSTIGAAHIRRDACWVPADRSTVLVPEKTEIRLMGKQSGGAGPNVVGHLDIAVSVNT